MNAADALDAFAAISVGVVGFSAIVVALASNTIIYEARRLHWGLGIIFCWALGALFFSVLPFIFFNFGMVEKIIWPLGLIVMGGYFSVAGASILSIDRRLNRAGLGITGKQHERPVRRSRAMVIAKFTYIFMAAMLFIAGAWVPNPGFYLVGMTVMLALSLWVLLFFFFLSGLLERRPDSLKKSMGSTTDDSDAGSHPQR